MTDKPKPPDFAAMMQAMVPGLAWQPSTMDRASRAQAAAAADALHKLNAPLEQLLARHREFQTTMADAAERLTALAAQLDAMATTYAQLNRTLEQTVAPYLSYVEQLERYAAGGSGRTR
jgi:chlorite dismutase